jgi:hypothetical protein
VGPPIAGSAGYGLRQASEIEVICQEVRVYTAHVKAYVVFATSHNVNNRVYNCHGGKRDGIPLDDLPAISAILNESDWTDQATAQTTFNEIVSRGMEFAEHLR